MDEADKYKQRLEVIAEKRRLQEEQDKARREMEEQKLRLQQLKRKSLRDQWLMEGAPSSPVSPDAHSPRSPLWGSQAQEIEKHIDKLQSQSQQLAEEKEKLKEQMEDGQMGAVEVEEAGSETVHAVVQNRENNTAGLETTEDDIKTNQSLQVDETVAVLTNGGGNLEADTDPTALEHRSQSTTNGPVVASEGVISMKLEAGSCVSEAEPHEVPNISINEEEEEEDGTLVIRAERVIVTDEDGDLPEDPKPQDDHGNDVQSEETPLANPEAEHEGGDAVEEVVKTAAALETFTQPESDETTEPTAEAEPAFADGDMQDDMKTSKDRDGETTDEGQAKQSEDSTSMQVQTPSHVIEGTTLSPVPVYSHSAPSPELEAESADAMSPEGAEAALKVQEPVIPPDQFQEVPLADPQENQRKEAGPEEQEPLLSEVKAADTGAEPAADDIPASTETHSPITASQGGETEAPKRKTCQCCSVM